jgi:transcriptional regulator with XRE-family HTH domain
VGVQLGEEAVFARPTLDLDAAEASDARQWPPVTVAAYQTVGEPVCVLVEVGASGPPTRFEPRQARPVDSAARRGGRGRLAPRWPAVSADRPEDRAFLAELGRRVRLHWLYRDLTQKQLGERVGLSRNLISLFEKGRHGIDVAALRRLAQALACPCRRSSPNQATASCPGLHRGTEGPDDDGERGGVPRRCGDVCTAAAYRSADVAGPARRRGRRVPRDARRDRTWRARRRSPPVSRGGGSAGCGAGSLFDGNPDPATLVRATGPQT